MSTIKWASESLEIKKEVEAKFVSVAWRRNGHSSEGIEIFEGESYGKPTPAWKGEFTVEGCDLMTVFGLLYDLEKRCAWDSATLDAANTRDVEVIEKDDGTQRRLRLCTSSPALGGVISSREFLDLIDWEMASDKKSIFIWSRGFASEVGHAASQGRVLGHNFGCGMRLFQLLDGVKVELIFHSIVNGWLPHSIVSKAMPGTIFTMAKSLRQASIKK